LSGTATQTSAQAVGWRSIFRGPRGQLTFGLLLLVAVARSFDVHRLSTTGLSYTLYLIAAILLVLVALRVRPTAAPMDDEAPADNVESDETGANEPIDEAAAPA
jgi:hypothetical protein